MDLGFAKKRWQQATEMARNWWNTSANVNEEKIDWEQIRQAVPAPMFWLVGKTQSGKSSLIRQLTLADDATIGNGFRPCTLTSRLYPFPNADAPVVTFLDTRGLDEPGYDASKDLAEFDKQAHLMIVTCRLMDFATGNLRESLRQYRQANRDRPMILVLTCWHEVAPRDAHPQPYPFDPVGVEAGQLPHELHPVSDEVRKLIQRQHADFQGLVDRIVPIDFTKPEEGYDNPKFGLEALKSTLLACLPEAYQGALRRYDLLTGKLHDRYLQEMMPTILGYSGMAASAGALPIPFLDLLLIPAIQSRMIHTLAKHSGRPLDARQFLEIAGAVGLGLLARQAVRELVKVIPFVGSAVGGAMAGASTYALGRAYCEYSRMVHEGHVPSGDLLRRLYEDQLDIAKGAWWSTTSPPDSTSKPALKS